MLPNPTRCSSLQRSSKLRDDSTAARDHVANVCLLCDLIGPSCWVAETQEGEGREHRQVIIHRATRVAPSDQPREPVSSARCPRRGGRRRGRRGAPSPRAAGGSSGPSRRAASSARRNRSPRRRTRRPVAARAGRDDRRRALRLADDQRDGVQDRRVGRGVTRRRHLLGGRAGQPLVDASTHPRVCVNATSSPR